MLPMQSSGNLFRSPAQTKMTFNIGSNPSVLEARSLTGFMFSLSPPASQHDRGSIRIVDWSLVPLQLARNGALIPFEPSGNLAQ
jgi:hypothetical protein